jgi:hypothetical protein
MTTMYRPSHDVSAWVPLMLAVILVAAVLFGVVGGIELSAPSIGFELPPGAPEVIPDAVPAHVLEMNVYGEAGGAVQLPPIHVIEQQIAGG